MDKNNKKITALHTYLSTIFPPEYFIISMYEVGKDGATKYLVAQKETSLFCDIEVDSTYLITKTEWFGHADTTS